ncbi:MAG: class I SAM-dependent methyltransferase [Verrucomicrobiaceae bacterium]|nr:MAG: class I SAM-dependent methyltransferase [Verrucomicrobiaceae bacterium]
MHSPEVAPPASFLIRIPEVFADLVPEILAGLGVQPLKRLGSEYFLVSGEHVDIRNGEFGKFVRWCLPVEHSWPCNPEKMTGFIEKAAQGLLKKFGYRKPQAILAGQLDPSASGRYYKTLASNLRGRTLQVFPAMEVGSAEEQHSGRATLFCLVGKEGLFSGMISPKAANGFHPGGTKYISQNAEDTISRAGAKIAEALHYIRLYLAELPAGGRWLELGASPGGMTSELLKRGFHVTAVDRAVLDTRLANARNLEFLRRDVSTFVPDKGSAYDAILSDMNGKPRDAFRQVARLSVFLKPQGLVVFTLKTTGVESAAAINELHRGVLEDAGEAWLEPVACTHLTYNRQEFTLFFRRRKA